MEQAMTYSRDNARAGPHTALANGLSYSQRRTPAL
jgi:hypothetical protein